MGFSDDVDKKAAPLREAILQHPFVTGIGDGTLNVEKFKFYVRQDYVYLIEYSRVLALAAARARGLEAMSWFARLLDETLNTEMELHRGYCARFGVTREELNATTAAPTTQGYTQFLVATAHQREYPELVAALLPCQWGYWEIGDHLARRGLPEVAPLYREWIEVYASPEYKALGDWLRNHADQLAEMEGPPTTLRMQDAFLSSLRYEYLFWEMAYKGEGWPV